MIGWRLFVGSRTSRLRDLIIAMAIFLVLVIPVAVVAERIMKRQRDVAVAGFKHDADQVLYSITGRLIEYKNLLNSAASQIETGRLPPVSATRYPEIVAFGYVEVAERTASGYVVRATISPQLAGVLDLARSKEQIAAADAAIAGNKPVMTKKSKKGPLLIFQPGAGRGFVILAFRPEVFVRQRFSRVRTIDIEIYDTPMSTASLLADSDSREQKGTAPRLPPLHYNTKVAAFSHTWTVFIGSYESFASRLRSPQVLFTVGSFLLAMLVWSFLSTRRRSFELGTKMLDTFADLVDVIDANGHVIYGTGSLSSKLGYPSDEIIGKKFVDFFHPDDQKIAIDALQRAATSDQPEKFGGVRIRTKDGSWHELDGSLQRMVVGKGEPAILVIAQDVTEVRALERQLDRAARVESLGRVAAKVAHEFNNVLMGLSTNVEILKRKYPDDERIQSVAETMRRTVTRGTHIAGEILRFSKPTALHEAPIDVQAWLRQIEEDLRPLLPTKIAFDLELPADRFLLCGDAGQLSQVMVNLILNARDAIRDEGRVLCTATRSAGGRFAFGVVPAGDFAHLRISDTGQGIPPEALQHIFEPLFTTKQQGTGLGLAISHQIVSAHNGYMFAESALGMGTDLHVFLPVATSAESCGSSR